MKLLVVNKIQHIKQCYYNYREIGTSTFDAILSALLKMPVHSLLFKSNKYVRKYLRKREFTYTEGVWLTLHFGLNHFRPLLIDQDCVYIRGEKVNYVEPYTKSNVSYVHINSRTSFLSLINKIKDFSIVCATIDGTVGTYDKFFYLGSRKISYNSTLISSSKLLQKRVFFELYYLDHFLNLKRKTRELSISNFEQEIRDLCLEIIRKFPHNARMSRLQYG